MRSSKWASLVAIVGGLAWVASAVLGWGDEPEQYSYLSGLVLLVLALAFGGYALVAVATPALGSMIWLTVEAAGTDYLMVVLAGAVMLLAGGIGLARGGSSAPGVDAQPDPPARGRRAAR